VGFYDYQARLYDPAVGRFLSADTLVPEAGRPQSWNRYAYVLNNPLKYTDPTGYFSNEQIEQYLRKHYGDDKWKMYWDAWESDYLFFSMLAVAEFGDVLFAPTAGMLGWEPNLPSGTFTQDGDTFSFSSEFGLEAYQGKGPYILEDKKGNEKLSFEMVRRSSLFNSNQRLGIGYSWDQPVYYYSEAHGPISANRIRSVSYEPNLLSLKIYPFSGDSLPWSGGFLAGRLAEKVGGTIFQFLGRAVSVLSAVTALNNAVTVSFTPVIEELNPCSRMAPASTVLPLQSRNVWAQ